MREQSVTPRIGQRSAHALCRGDVADLADRPFGGDPFAGRMRKHSREPKEARFPSISVAWIVAISCRPRLLRMISSPLDSGA